MVNAGVTDAEARAAERDLAIGYAPVRTRAGVAALFALDDRLGAILRATREPLAGQMRLTWWHEALIALDRAPAPAEPVLAALAAEVLPRGMSGEALAAMIDGWEVLLDEPVPDDAALRRFAAARGGGLFAAAAQVSGHEDVRVSAIGEGWALADLARHLSDAGASARAAALAKERLGDVRGRWARPVRPLAAMALLARSDLDGGVPGSPGRVTRLLAMRLTGY